MIDLAALAQLMVDVNGEGEYRVCPFPPEREAIDIGGYYADFSKIRTQVDWSPKTPLRKTIEITLNIIGSIILTICEAGTQRSLAAKPNNALDHERLLALKTDFEVLKITRRRSARNTVGVRWAPWVRPRARPENGICCSLL